MDPKKLQREMVALFAYGIVVIAILILGSAALGIVPRVTVTDPGMAVSTALCFLGCGICILALNRR